MKYFVCLVLVLTLFTGCKAKEESKDPTTNEDENILQAQKGAVSSQAYGYIDFLEKQITSDLLDDVNASIPTKITAVDPDYTGSKPTKVELTLEEGIVVSGTLHFPNNGSTFSVTIEDGKVANVQKL